MQNNKNNNLKNRKRYINLSRITSKNAILEIRYIRSIRDKTVTLYLII